MEQRTIVCLLLLNFLNNIFFHAFYKEASPTIAFITIADEEANEVDNLLELMTQWWVHTPGEPQGDTSENSPDEFSFEKEFLSSSLHHVMASGLPVNSFLLEYVPPFLPHTLLEIVAPPPDFLVNHA